jgi:Animal haem peroxidase
VTAGNDQNTARYEIATLVSGAAERLDRMFGWDNMPLPVGMMTLWALRLRLRERNLYPLDLEKPTQKLLSEATLPVNISARRRDGRFNDRDQPLMGAACTPFGRNSAAIPEQDPVGEPRPEEISERLLKRDEFIPAPGLNLLAAAWVQFEVHDWFSHLNDDNRTWAVGDNEVPRLWQDPTTRSPTLVSTETHWWDGSQLYGTDPHFAADVRADDGLLKVDDELFEAIERFVDRRPGHACREGKPARGLANLWPGLGLMHNLFAKEHNAVCAMLEKKHPSWPAERRYQTARLVNSALMAKIHTLEWTPAVIAHPTTSLAIRATWWGLLGERLHRKLGRLSRGELLSGIPGSATEHDGVPYSLTEDFVAVYRMHPLLPDEVTFARAGDGAEIGTWELKDLTMRRGELNRPRVFRHAVDDLDAFYSLGNAHAGAITLRNYPDFLRNLKRFDDSKLDLAAVDILRSRECAIAPYNRFRRMFRLRPVQSWAELAGGNPMLAAEMRDVYRGNFEAVDLMVGLFGERRPAGFAFSETAFRVFLLMAARRLRSDRFFTTDFRPEIYSPAGLEWVSTTTFSDMLLRHYPRLRRALRGVENPFKPWES